MRTTGGRLPEGMRPNWQRISEYPTIRIPNRLQDALKERKYREEGAALDYLRYDANLNRLMAKVGQTEYWFALPNDKARELHARWISASVEGAAEDDPDRTRWLVDPASGGRYLGLPREVLEAREHAAAEEKPHQQEPLARIAWVDTSTGLMWTLHDNGKDVNWEGAKNYCRSLDLGGISWRLPEIGELKGLYQPGQPQNAKGVQLSTYWAWSATTDSTHSGGAWYLYFGNGGRNFAGVGTTYVARALCVRRAGE